MGGVGGEAEEAEDGAGGVDAGAAAAGEADEGVGRLARRGAGEGALDDLLGDVAQFGEAAGGEVAVGGGHEGHGRGDGVDGAARRHSMAARSVAFTAPACPDGPPDWARPRTTLSARSTAVGNTTAATAASMPVVAATVSTVTPSPRWKRAVASPTRTSKATASWGSSERRGSQ